MGHLLKPHIQESQVRILALTSVPFRRMTALIETKQVTVNREQGFDPVLPTPVSYIRSTFHFQAATPPFLYSFHPAINHPFVDQRPI
jgi:hypothetical protein